MIFHSKIEVERLVPTGERDEYGDELVDVVTVVHRAEVRPIDSDEAPDRSAPTVTRLRMFLPARADVTASDRIRWRGASYAVQGDVERHEIGGRVHHQEAIVARSS